MTTTTSDITTTGTSLSDVGLLLLRIATGAAMLQAGLIKAFDFGTTAGFMEAGGWRLSTFAAFMVTAAEVLGGLGLLFGVLTPLAGAAVLAAMLDAWAVNVSGGAFWSDPFNVPFFAAAAAAALILTGAGAYSLDSKVLGRSAWPARVSLGLLAVGVVAAVVTWIALNGTNPIHFAAPA
jgi:uncharacterized membrane protein YphA (DoxX/SURF4 family)